VSTCTDQKRGTCDTALTWVIPIAHAVSQQPVCTSISAMQAVMPRSVVAQPGVFSKGARSTYAGARVPCMSARGRGWSEGGQWFAACETTLHMRAPAAVGGAGKVVTGTLQQSADELHGVTKEQHHASIARRACDAHVIRAHRLFCTDLLCLFQQPRPSSAQRAVVSACDQLL
jgi:hypothetical protein